MDQATGARHRVEPDKSLRKYRDVDEGAPLKGCMGMQLCPMFENTRRYEDMETMVEVGMTMEVLKRGSHFYVKQ